MSKKVAIQGIAGSFHHVASQKMLGNGIAIVPFASFRELVSCVENDPGIDCGLMAIENSIAGSILPNYVLLQNSELTVTGEVYLSVQQNLLVIPGTGIENIAEVHSHPMALLQCSNFLDSRSWKLIETEDTAFSAKFIAENKLSNIAAIGSTLAAEQYGLEILRSSIQNESNNYTRFLLLERSQQITLCPAVSKASAFLELPHHAGSLARVLSIIGGCGLNLTKIQSIPLSKTPWKYAFHIDFEFDKVIDFDIAMSIVENIVDRLKIYGIYKKAVQDDS